MDDVAETYKLWSIRKTIMEMCRDRGYKVSEEEVSETLERFILQFGDKPSDMNPSRSQLNLIYSKVNNEKNKLSVFFPDELKVGIGEVKSILHEMQSTEVSRGIIILKRKMSFYAKNFLLSCRSKVLVETFLDVEVTINITHHELVPKHIVMTAEEKKELLAKYKMNPSQMMKILTSDPVTRYFGLSPGIVVKIIRPSETTGEYTSYRLVV